MYEKKKLGDQSDIKFLNKELARQEQLHVMIMRSKATSEKKPMMIVSIAKTPIRVVSKALDLYAKCMTNFAINYNRPLMIMESSRNSQQLNHPSSFSTCDSDHLPGALIRAIPITTSTIQDMRNSASVTMRCAKRTLGVGMRTIFEDRVCSFKDENIVRKRKLANKICLIVNCINR